MILIWQTFRILIWLVKFSQIKRSSLSTTTPSNTTSHHSNNWKLPSTKFNHNRSTRANSNSSCFQMIFRRILLILTKSRSMGSGVRRQPTSFSHWVNRMLHWWQLSHCFNRVTHHKPTKRPKKKHKTKRIPRRVGLLTVMTRFLTRVMMVAVRIIIDNSMQIILTEPQMIVYPNLI